MEQQNTSASAGLSTQDKMVRGSIWLTAGNIISRLLGAIYVIPWYAWMGTHARAANSLFTMGYNVYALFLMISTAGIPSAIAKQIAHYNSLNEYKVSLRLFKQSLLIMGGIGVVAAAIMYLASPALAAGNAALIPVMRSLSCAVLIFPIMSAVRGFFQGNHNMMPTAISQVIEQVVRVFYMLLATFIIMKVAQGDYTSAVTQSTFAAFVGMLGACGVLAWFLWKQKSLFTYLVEESEDNLSVSTLSLFGNIARDAVPFIIVGSAITLLKIFDQYTFFNIMGSFTNYTRDQLYDIFSLFSANPDKLTMVVIALATSLSATALPLISEAYTLKDHHGLAKLVTDSLQLFAFVMLPATFGMISLAYPLNTLFYEPSALGTRVLIEACVVGVVTGLYMLTSSTLQGLGRHKQTLQYLAAGFVVKMVLQVPMVYFFEVYGPLLSTGLGLSIAIFFNLREIHNLSRFNKKLTARRTLLILMLSVAMWLVAGLSRLLLGTFISAEHKATSFVLIILVAAIGAAFYGFLVLKLRLADKLLGPRVAGLRRKFHIS
ncbi:putative polysaccharide biosynthesis protein [Enterococcus nangangensis]